MARFCNKCNAPIEAGGYFCTECGSNDIRDDEEQKEEEKETTPSEEIEVKDTSTPSTEIPEMETNTVRSFGDKSIEQLQNAEIKSINSLEPTTNEMKETTQEEAQPNPSTNSFADVPDYMNHTQTINIPSDFQLQEGDYNNYNNQENVSQTIPYNPKIKSRSKRSDKKILRVVFAIVGAMVVLFLIAFVLSNRTDNAPFSETDIEPNTGETLDFSTIFTPENSFRVGNATLGYISIPNTWAQVQQEEGSKAQQFTDGTSWVVTLMSTPTDEYSAVTYANNVYDSIKVDGGQNITTGKTKIAGYTALTITAYYPNQKQYLTTWCLESKNGQTHYLAIEGPESGGDNYNIIYSFQEDK